DFDIANIAYSWLQGLELELDQVRALGMRSVKKQPIEIVRGLSWMMSLGGPTLIAIDQIDAIISESKVRTRAAVEASANGLREAQSILEALAQGLMDLHEVTRQSVTVVTCLEATWQVLRGRASVPMTDRYGVPTLLQPLRDGATSRALVAARLHGA